MHQRKGRLHKIQKKRYASGYIRTAAASLHRYMKIYYRHLVPVRTYVQDDCRAARATKHERCKTIRSFRSCKEIRG